MKRIFEIVTSLAAILALTPAAGAQTAGGQAAAGVAKMQSALAATGIPLWAWAILAAAVVLALVLAVSRRRKPTQAVIKTRLG